MTTSCENAELILWLQKPWVSLWRAVGRIAHRCSCCVAFIHGEAIAKVGSASFWPEQVICVLASIIVAGAVFSET
jgi:hypothetical protein